MGKKKELKNINLKLQSLIDILSEKESIAKEEKEINLKLQYLIDILIRIEKNIAKEERGSSTTYEFAKPSTTKYPFKDILIGKAPVDNFQSPIIKPIYPKDLFVDPSKVKLLDDMKKHYNEESDREKENK